MMHIARLFLCCPPLGAALGAGVMAAAGAPSGCDEPTNPATQSDTTPQDWTRFGWDAARSNAPTGTTGITAQNVVSLVRRQVALDGTVDGSAIYLHGVQVNGVTHDAFFVTTTYGKTIAIDAAQGTVLWRYTPTGYDTWAGSYRITTATPVADPDRAHLYAASPDGYIQKLAVADGQAVWRRAITTLPEREKIPAALNYFGGRVVATTGGYIGDAPPYQGHVALLDAASGQLVRIWNALCSDRPALLDPQSCSESGSAIWGRGGAVIDTASGDLFLATGDGRWDGATYWGDAVLELNAGATALAGNYTPTNTDQLDAGDVDLGSTAPVLLGGGLVAQGGKDRTIRILDWSSARGASPHQGGERQVVSTPSGGLLFSAPAVWRTPAATWLFAADNGGTAAWTVGGDTLRPMWKNGNGGTSPVVADGLLFVYDPGGGLRVYRADTGQLVTTLASGAGHWNSPIVVDGRIALPEGNANSHGTTGVFNIWRQP